MAISFRHLLGLCVVLFIACGRSEAPREDLVHEPPEMDEMAPEIDVPETLEPCPDCVAEPEEPVVEEDRGVTLEPDGGVVVRRARRLSRPTLRVMTYNIKKGNMSSLAQIAQVIRDQAPDLVALQEVEASVPNQGKRLGDMLGMHSAFVHTNVNKVGNAVLSRFPVVKANGIMLPSTSLQRALLITRFDIDGQPVRFGATHLAHDSHLDRMNQMTAILDRMNGANFQLLAGDFNAFPGKSPAVLEMVNAAFDDAWVRGGEGRGATAPALNPSPGVRIDYVMLGRGYVSPVKAIVPHAPTQSDHRPVVATLIKPWSQSLLGDQVPEIEITDRTAAAEVGVKVRFNRPGIVEGVRFYRAAGNPDGYLINLWTADGTLLSTARVEDQAGAGWIEAGFRAPIRVRKDTTYVVSYFSSNGRFAKTPGVHATPLRSGDVVATGSEGSGNGLHALGATSHFPGGGAGNGSSWFVDVRFRPE